MEVKNQLTMRRLDFFLISDTLQFSMHSCEMLNPLHSDHSLIKIKFKSLNAMKGTGYWKFNNSSLDDKIFVQNIKSKINETIPNINSYSDPRVGWEYLKYKMREYAREIAIKNARQRKKSRVELEQKVLNLEMDMTDNPSAEKIADYSTAKLELEKFYEYITDGIIMRSKSQWYEEGGKSTKYLLSLEKRNKVKSNIRKLCLKEENDETTDPKQTLDELKQFYSGLYTKKSTKTEQECMLYLEDINTPTLTEEKQKQCDRKLTHKEIWDSLTFMKNGKPPGNDGLTKEFYLALFGELGRLMVTTFNYSFSNGELSTSQKQAVITLIQKKDRDVRFIKNWRPISLLNVDLKIASKAIAYRLRKIIPDLIHPDQTAYVKGRYIGESVRVTEDILEHADQENLDGILFAADIENNFDSVEHSFIFTVLKNLVLGMILYNGLKLCSVMLCYEQWKFNRIH